MNFIRRTEPCPRPHAHGAAGGPVASMTIAGTQVTARRSGGSSSREARRAGRMHRGGEGRSRPAASGRECPQMARVAVSPKGPADEALGNPESPHGAEFRHGLEAARAGPAAGTGAGGKTFVPRGPQQQDAPRHRLPHSQWCAWSSVSMAADGETEDAPASARHPRTSTSTAAGNSRRTSLCVQEYRGRGFMR